MKGNIRVKLSYMIIGNALKITTPFFVVIMTEIHLYFHFYNVGNYI